MYECSAKCPKCGGEVEWDFACHTYPNTNSVCPVQNNSHQLKWNNGNPWCLDCDAEATTRTTWMACMPCDSATRYVCIAHNESRCGGIYVDDCAEGYHEGCGWNWTWGLNPNNPRSVENETKNPNWGENELE